MSAFGEGIGDTIQEWCVQDYISMRAIFVYTVDLGTNCLDQLLGLISCGLCLRRI